MTNTAESYKGKRQSQMRNTVNFENRIRKEEENPERNTYNGYKIPNEIKDQVTIWE